MIILNEINKTLCILNGTIFVFSNADVVVFQCSGVLGEPLEYFWCPGLKGLRRKGRYRVCVETTRYWKMFKDPTFIDGWCYWNRKYNFLRVILLFCLLSFFSFLFVDRLL